MGNQPLITPDQEPTKSRPAEDEPALLLEADGSMWTSLISNLRDAFSSSKQPPLQLSSKPVAVVEATEEEPVWKTLGSSLQDLFFPKKLPPLELTSQPIAVADPMAVKRGPLSSSLAILLHVVVIALILLFAWEQWKTRPIEKKTVATNVDIKPFIPMTKKMNQSMGGGSGRATFIQDVLTKGHLPKKSQTQIPPPQIIKNDVPQLAVEPTIVIPQEVKLPDAKMPDIGV